MAEHNEELAQGRTVDVRVVDTVSVDPGAVQVSLKRSATQPTADQPLWVAIRNRTQAISFNRYHDFINRVLCEAPIPELEEPPPPGTREGYGSPSFTQRRIELAGRLTIHGVDAYSLLRLATEAFLIFECGLVHLPRNSYTLLLVAQTNTLR